MLLFEVAYSRILTVVLLRHFHDIHQSSCRNSQWDGWRNQTYQRIYRTCQCTGQRQKHGHSSVTDCIAPYTVDSPSITTVRYDKSDNGHENRSQNGHLLEVQSHVNIIFLKRFQFLCIKVNQVESLDCLDIGESFLVKSIKLCIHSRTSLIVITHSFQQRLRKQSTDGNSKQCKKCKSRVIIKHDCQCTDKTKSINDQVGNPVQDSAWNIGGIGTPACHQISGVVIGQGFPVSDQHFGKDVVLDFGVHLQVNESRGISGCLRNQNVCDREADHCGKGTYKFPGLVSGNNIHQISGNQTGNQRDTCSDQTKQCIQDHGFPVTSAVLIDP